MQPAPLHLIRRLSLSGLCLLCALALAAQARTGTLLVLGDSISAAYGMSLQQGWVSLLGAELAQTDPGVEIVNASISGETSDGALRRLPALLERHRPAVVVLEIGGNDGLRGFPIPTLRDNLTRLATLAGAAGARVVILPMELPPNYGRRYTEAFRATYPEVADATGSLLAPFILAGIATDPGQMQADGIHPQVQAQPAMLANVLPAIREALR